MRKRTRPRGRLNAYQRFRAKQASASGLRPILPEERAQVLQCLAQLRPPRRWLGR